MAGYNTRYLYGRQEDTEPIKTQKQLQISLEATKQKIYTIHGNVINILEELEDRIQKKNGRPTLPKSSTDFYDHREKCDDTVEEQVQVQMLALEIVLKGCDHRVKDQIRKELKENTKMWINVRQDYGLPRDIVDTYSERILEVITKGKTTHAQEFLDSKSKDYYAFDKEDVHMILGANYKASEVDKQFQKDPKRKAKSTEIRKVRKDDVHFMSMTGYNDTLLILLSDGNLMSLVLSFEGEKASQQLKEITIRRENNPTPAFTQIYELPRGRQVLAIDEKGQLYYSDRTLDEWKSVLEQDSAVSKLIIGTEAVIAVDDKKRIFEMDKVEPFIWKKNKEIQFKGVDRITDVTLGKNSRIWAISPEKGIITCDLEKHWEVTSSSLEVNFQKIYANPWNEQLWAVDSKGNVFYCQRLPDSKSVWKQDNKGIAPQVKMLATMEQGIVGLDLSYDLWYRKFPNLQENTDTWKRLHGLSLHKYANHLISMTGHTDKLLVVLDDGQVLSTVLLFQEEKESQSWNVVMNRSNDDLTAFAQIYKLPRNHEVLATDKPRKLHHLDGNLGERKPLTVDGIEVRKLLCGREAVFAVDYQMKFWEMNMCDPLKWKENKEIQLEDIGRLTDLTLEKDSRIWAISPEKGIIRWDLDKHRDVTSYTLEMKFQKIYANPWNEELWAVDDVGNVYHLKYPSDYKCAWEVDKQAPKVKMWATVKQAVVVLDMNDALWYRKFPNFQENTGAWISLELASSSNRSTDESTEMDLS